MSFNYSPKIVTNGLVLCLDAANTKSYVSGSTVWTDLSRSGINGTLTNGPTFSSANGGTIVFDGVDDYVNLGSFQSLINNFTLTTWCKITSTTGANILGFYNTSSPYNGWGVGYSQNPLNGSKLNFWDGSSWINSNITIADSIWRQICIVVSSTYLVSFYINGIFSTSIQAATISSFSGTKAIGARNDGVGSTSGNIAQTQIYNRALSAAEVLQNYNATKGRYGL
jgi:hypothetical protein